MHSNKCPRGFKWCDQRQECIPERNGEKVHQVKGRYFFKGDGYMDKNTQYASEVVDMAFDEGFEVFTKLKIAEKKIERLLDMCGKHHTSECGTMEDDAPGDSQDEYIEEPPITGPNKIDHVPNQHFGTLYSSLRKQIGELRKLTKEGKDEYRAFFKKMLNKFGVNSPAELDDEKKKAFFNAVDKGWKAKKESIDLSEVQEDVTPETQAKVNSGIKTAVSIGAAALAAKQMMKRRKEKQMLKRMKEKQKQAELMRKAKLKQMSKKEL